eukprot:6201904-Pleurochrysis_carterae.AAC.1
MTTLSHCPTSRLSQSSLSFILYYKWSFIRSVNSSNYYYYYHRPNLPQTSYRLSVAAIQRSASYHSAHNS